ncbi:hypothetical protein [Flagellimonas sp. 2504JD1-5]
MLPIDGWGVWVDDCPALAFSAKVAWLRQLKSFGQWVTLGEGLSYAKALDNGLRVKGVDSEIVG